jgi:hypothetical protein
MMKDDKSQIVFYHAWRKMGLFPATSGPPLEPPARQTGRASGNPEFLTAPAQYSSEEAKRDDTLLFETLNKERYNDGE